MEKLNKIDFVLICNPTWELKIGSNIRNIALELSKNHRVLYVNPPLDKKTVLTNKKDPEIIKKIKVLKGETEDLKKIGENLWLLEPRMMAESINWIPNTALFKFFNKKNSNKYAICIKSALSRLKFDQYVLLNDSLMFRGFDLKELLKPKVYSYYIRDYLISQPYFKKHGLQMEPELIRKSDIIFANSVFLKNFAKKYNEKSFYIGQGYENTYFNVNNKFTMPADLANIKNPIVGYVGTLTSLRLDEKMLIHAAENLPQMSFVFVGPEDDLFKNSKLHQIKNVYFLGLKPMQELASYVNFFDVCINPQLVNDLTIGNYPLKIDEYLSMGKPTVATKTEAMESFKDYTYLATNYEEFVEYLKLAIQENTEEKSRQRIEFASRHTWENCINEIYVNLIKIL